MGELAWKEGAGDIETQPRTLGGDESAREKIQSGWKEDKRFEGEGEVGALHWQRGPDGPG